jgi:hypothetical protein
MTINIIEIRDKMNAPILDVKYVTMFEVIETIGVTRAQSENNIFVIDYESEIFRALKGKITGWGSLTELKKLVINNFEDFYENNQE